MRGITTLQNLASLSFSAKLEYGEEGEQHIAQRLIDRGVAVMPLYQFTSHDKAPFMLSGDSQVTMPDLGCWKDGRSFFVECKRKNQWVKFKGSVETGFNYRHFSEYKKVKTVTGLDVWVVFKHEGVESGLFVGEVGELAKNVRYWDGLSGNRKVSQPLALFPKTCLKKWGNE